MPSFLITADEEVRSPFMERPHVVLLGAGASKAALPRGDSQGRPVPLLREVAADLGLDLLFPNALRALSKTDFEAAYSRLLEEGDAPTRARAHEIEESVSSYFSDLDLPPEPTIYDALLLCLRQKDAIFTFNWDPFLIQALNRLVAAGARRPPKLFFLHGNVAVGYCDTDRVSGLLGNRCSTCGIPFARSRLLFPVEKKNYQDSGLIEREWRAIRHYLKSCFMLTIFGYSAPKTDVEAKALLKEGWGPADSRNTEQTEIVCRPGADEESLRQTWREFIHTHHYQVSHSFWNSWLASHPRRTGEAYWNQNFEAKFVANNQLPANLLSIGNLVRWFQPLYEAEEERGHPQ